MWQHLQSRQRGKFERRSCDLKEKPEGVTHLQSERKEGVTPKKKARRGEIKGLSAHEAFSVSLINRYTVFSLGLLTVIVTKIFPVQSGRQNDPKGFAVTFDPSDKNIEVSRKQRGNKELF